MKNIVKNTILVGLALTVASPLKAFNPKDYWQVLTGAGVTIGMGVGALGCYLLTSESDEAREARLKKKQEEAEKSRKELAENRLHEIQKSCEYMVSVWESVNGKLTESDIEDLALRCGSDQKPLYHIEFAGELRETKDNLLAVRSILSDEKKKQVDRLLKIVTTTQSSQNRYCSKVLTVQYEKKQEIDTQREVNKNQIAAAEIKYKTEAIKNKTALEEQARIRDYFSNAENALNDVSNKSQAAQIAIYTQLVAQVNLMQDCRDQMKTEYTQKGVTGLSNRIGNVEKMVGDASGQVISIKKMTQEMKNDLSAIKDTQRNQNQKNSEILTELRDLKKKSEAQDNAIANIAVSLAELSEKPNEFPLSGGEPSAPPAHFFN